MGFIIIYQEENFGFVEKNNVNDAEGIVNMFVSKDKSNNQKNTPVMSYLYFISNSMPRVIKRILLNLFKVYPFTVFSFYCFYLKTLAFKIVSFI